MNRPTTILVSSLALAALIGCGKDRTVQAAATTSPTTAHAAAPQGMPPTMPPGMAGATASGTVEETMDASTYTYVRVKTAQGDIWAAANQFKVAKGDQVVVPLNMPMQNFESKTLHRTFPVIYFAARIENQGKAK